MLDKHDGQAFLLNSFTNALQTLINVEKQLVKVYLRLEKAAHTAELTKALTPEISEHIQHLGRLKLISSSLKLKANHLLEKENIPLLKLSAKKTAAQDLAIISYALKLQNLKLAYYEFLHPLSKALAFETEASLLEQSITDNSHTNTWLRQIIQNIIAQEKTC